MGPDDGMTTDDAAEAGPDPASLAALTVKAYAVPSVRPVTVQVVAPTVVQVPEGGELVTVYPVIGVNPIVAGPAHETVTMPSPGIAVTAVGAPGTVRTVRVAVAESSTV
jgi:hypothetical protein